MRPCSACDQSFASIKTMGNETSSGNQPPRKEEAIKSAPGQSERSEPRRQPQQREQQQQKRDHNHPPEAGLSGGQEVSGKDGQGNTIPQV